MKGKKLALFCIEVDAAYPKPGVLGISNWEKMEPADGKKWLILKESILLKN